MDDSLGFLMAGLSAAGAIIAAFAAIVALLPAARQMVIARRELKLNGYSSAIQTILELKESFSDNPDTFQKLLDREPRFQSNIPAGLTPVDFLTVVRAFWRLSYIHSITLRWRELGMNEEEKKSLEREIRAWLSMSTFREVYNLHFRKLRTLKPSFEQFIDAFYDHLDRDPMRQTAQLPVAQPTTNHIPATQPIASVGTVSVSATP